MPDIVGVDTILEGVLPDRAANYDSLAAFAAKTQEDWEGEIWGAEQQRWGGRVLGGLFEGLEQGKPFVLALLQAMIRSIFDNPTDNYPDADSALVGIASKFSGKWRDLLTVKDSSLYTAAQVAAAGRPIYDLFDGSGELSGSWDVSYAQPLAGGRIRQDGEGNCWWSGFGFAARTGRALYTAAETDTDVQIITVVMPNTVQANSLGSPSHLRLLGRCDDTLDNYVYAHISDDTVELGCVVDGEETSWASAAVTPADSDVWDFLVGTGDDYYFQLKRNGVSALDYTDTGTESMKGAGFRKVGFEMHAASRGLYGQTSPGTLAVFSADDN